MNNNLIFLIYFFPSVSSSSHSYSSTWSPCKCGSLTFWNLPYSAYFKCACKASSFEAACWKPIKLWGVIGLSGFAGLSDFADFAGLSAPAPAPAPAPAGGGGGGGGAPAGAAVTPEFLFASSIASLMILKWLSISVFKLFVEYIS